MYQASVSFQHHCYVVAVSDDLHSFRPVANFGWDQGAAMETRDLINRGRIDYDRVCAKIRLYDPKVLYGYPRYRGDRIDFTRRRKYVWETFGE